MLANRRQFIKRCLSLYGSLLLLPACNLSRERKKYYCFSTDEAHSLEAICEQLIPTDEFPGAKEAGVLNYIDKLLYQRFPQLKEQYQAGLAGLDAYTRDRWQKDFSSLAWTDQTVVLQKMENGELPPEYWKSISQREFFDLVLRHTMQGYYGSPRHGGNKEYVSYRMMKLDYPLLIGQNRYEK